MSISRCVFAAAFFCAVFCADVKGTTDKVDLKGKKVLMVIAPANFRDEELATPRRMLRDAGAAVTVASTTRKEIRGMLGMKTRADVLLKDVQSAEFDAIVFVGGSGATVLFENPDAHRLARDGVRQKKVVAAICIAPCILAKAGVLKGRKATVWPGGQFVRILEENGAVVLAGAVVTDGRLITGNGPEASAPFADRLISLLAGPVEK